MTNKIEILIQTAYQAITKLHDNRIEADGAYIGTSDDAKKATQSLYDIVQDAKILATSEYTNTLDELQALRTQILTIQKQREEAEKQYAEILRMFDDFNLLEHELTEKYYDKAREHNTASYQKSKIDSLEADAQREIACWNWRIKN